MPAIVHNRILIIGFQSDISIPQYFRELFGTSEEIRAKLDADHARIQRAGIQPVVFHLDPLEKEKGLRRLEALLQEGQYDAIGIGAGVRLHPEYTSLFETIVNMCVAAAPGVPLLFNDGPGASAETSE